MPAGHHPSKKPLQVIKKNCRFSRRITREASMSSSSPSMEDNYDGGVSVAVPFRWESEPGTPKVTSRDTTPLPPLTPPPSYFYSPKTPTTRSSSSSSSKPSKSHILDIIFPRRATKKTTNLPSSPAFSSSSSSGSFSSGSYSPWPPVSLYSVPSSSAEPPDSWRRHCNVPSHRLSFDSRAVEAAGDDGISGLCFRRGGTNPRFRGCYASVIKVLLH